MRPHGAPALALTAACAALLLAAAAAAPAADPPAAADAFLNEEGLPLMMPTNVSTDGRRWYYEVPRDPVGLLVMLHRCGRNAEDFWPPSEACPQCIGMPEGVSISKQGLARGYALLAINSFNRSVGSLGRCWSWSSDSEAVKHIVTKFRRQHRLEKLPLFFTGCSSGGSLALRLPSIMAIDGIMPVAIGLDPEAFPAADPKLRHPYPPVVYIHFAADENTAKKVGGMLEYSESAGLPAAEQQVGKFAIGPEFFSDRDPMISRALSVALHAGLERIGVLDANNILTDDWEAAGGPPPWDALLRDELAGMVAGAAGAQRALKNRTMLARAQAALGAAGEELLTIQEVFDGSVSAATLDEQAAAADENPNFSAADGVSPAGGGGDPYLSPELLYEHIHEEIAVAWAHHTNLGDFTTAVLVWLERCGQANYGNMAEALEVTEPAALSPVRVATSAQVLPAWRACQAGGGWDAVAEALESSGLGGGTGQRNRSEGAASGAARRRAAGGTAVAAALAAAAALVLA